MSFWQNKRVVVTGGDGFLGWHVVDVLNRRGIVPFLAQNDLRETPNVKKMYQEARPDIVIHLAA